MYCKLDERVSILVEKNTQLVLVAERYPIQSVPEPVHW